MSTFIIGAFFVLLGLGIAWRQRKRRRTAQLKANRQLWVHGPTQLPRATGEVYVPKNEDDIPGWEKP